MDPALFAQAKLRFLICRLSTYRDVSISTSHSLVAQIAQEVEHVFVDFAFLPPPKDLEIMSASQVPLWVGTTTKEPPSAFDVLGISNSFVLELLNLPALLLFSGIPLFKKERMLRSDIPLIVLGGANAAVTAVLHGPAEGQGFRGNGGLVDAVILGEGELSVKQFLRIVLEGKLAGMGKTEILRSCHGKVDGFYEPDKYIHRYITLARKQHAELETNGKKAGNHEQGLRENTLAEIMPKAPYVAYPVKSAIVYDLDQARALESGPIWYETENLGTGSIQISSGCPCFCSFCAESWERKPYRERSLRKLLEGMRAAKAQQGLNSINLSSFNFNTHTELYSIIKSFYEEIASISLKSQRFDLLAADRFLADAQKIIGKTTVSCGMEGISERLRKYLHKNLTEEHIYKACEFLFEKGIRELKIFLIRTGLEQPDDLLEFRTFVERLEKLKSMTNSKARIIFSLTPLYYPPHTPLQFHACTTALEDDKHTRKELNHLCRTNGMEFRESASHTETWLMQLLAMGDRQLTPALIRSSIIDGFFYYNSVPKYVFSRWRAYLHEAGLSEGYYFNAKEKDHVFPWDDITMGIKKNFLWEEYERSIRFTEQEYCLGRPQVKAQCLGCGACPTSAQINKITQHKISQPFLLEELDTITKKKRNTFILQATIEIDQTMRLVPKQFFGVAIARALMIAMPEITPYYQSVTGHLMDFTDERKGANFAYGINRYCLAFLPENRAKVLLQKETLLKKLGSIQKQCKGFFIKEMGPEPGNISDIQYILYRIRFPKDFTISFLEQKLGEHLHTNYVKHTVLKRQGATVFKVDDKTKKNAIVLYARIDTDLQQNEVEEKHAILLAATKRFNVQSFLETCYGFKRKREIVCAEIETLGYYGKKPSTEKKAMCSSCNNDIHETFAVGKPLEINQCLVCSIDKKL
ncbi:MAG: radical SAM protein [Candidatus Brocadiaceae bacterium]|nr:radical SAM protein [Candidatus Brocadiaceae bacterium]